MEAETEVWTRPGKEVSELLPTRLPLMKTCSSSSRGAAKQREEEKTSCGKQGLLFKVGFSGCPMEG